MGILIVDDTEEMRLYCKTLLENGGYGPLFTAASAEEAYRILGLGDESAVAAAGIDLILMDVAMPGVDGIEALKHIKGDKRSLNIPVIMISGISEEGLLEIALDAGAIEYICKPVRKIELLARVRAVLRLKKEMDLGRERERRLLQMARKLDAQVRRLKEPPPSES